MIQFLIAQMEKLSELGLISSGSFKIALRCVPDLCVCFRIAVIPFIYYV